MGCTWDLHRFAVGATPGIPHTRRSLGCRMESHVRAHVLCVSELELLEAGQYPQSGTTSPVTLQP